VSNKKERGKVKRLTNLYIDRIIQQIKEKRGTAMNITTDYCDIEYPNTKTLKRFNRGLYLRKDLRSTVNGMDTTTLELEVIAKVNVMIKRAMKVLGMYSLDQGECTHSFKIGIMEHHEDVANKFKEIYSVERDYLAFYSRSAEQVFFSSKDINLQIFVHEIGHVIAEMYFSPSPPMHIHEVLAQYTEKYIYS
jgi:hypothetical protein